VRFRMKRTVPFDLESAAVSFYPQVVSGGKYQVVVVAAALEIVAKYEAPFRIAGFHPGIVTTSALASVDLERRAGVNLIAKLSGRVLTISSVRDGNLKLVRCLEVSELTYEDVTGVLFPTVAFVEDVEAVKPSRLSLCGFGDIAQRHAEAWESELGMQVGSLRSPIATAEPFNSGLLGYLESFSRGAVMAPTATGASAA
ncbi:MAG TPA: hypothetical protein VE621_17160, partial [Bryobacteraceae bacterium]|nr:hypothetical protein [Bryobacteraceae bacterium]